ncbi:MAG: sigma 54-interacting transcriptional regulator [Deferribacterales bacterium]
MRISETQLEDFLSISPANKSITIFGERMLIFDAVALGLLRKELIETFGVSGARNVLTRFGYAHGYRTAEMLKTKYPDFFSNLNAGATLHTLLGLVCALDVSEAEINGQKAFLAVIENSYESEQHVMNFGLSNKCVCWTLTGFASGFETFKRNREFYFVEVECTGKGDKCCTMRGMNKEDWGSELDDHLPFYGMASSNAILKDMAQKLQQAQESLKSCQKKLSSVSTTAEIIARSTAMQGVLEMASITSRFSSSVVISGESGTGKEVIARFIHNNSSRSKKPFIVVNCGAFTENLLESELFGHMKGAFTGATRDHKGLFEEADPGTVFLDEIGEMSLSMQVKLLRVLQEMEIRRVGESHSRHIDVRIIAATNKKLADEVEKGNFRRDLYYRLKVIEITIPPLRDRKEDILPLAYLFLKRTSCKLKKNVTGISSLAANCLLHYSWPGNVRELQNIIERSVVVTPTNFVESESLPNDIREFPNVPTGENEITPLERVIKNYILYALEISCGDKNLAAEKLNIGISTLYKKLKEYNK